MARKYIFNLIQPLQTPKTGWDKIYDWIITRAKVVLIISEILIVIAFGAKIVVDNIGKNRMQVFDQIKTEVDIISSNNEANFRKIQQKESEYRNLWNRANYYSDVINEINSYLQFSGNLNFSISGDDLTISGFEDLDKISELENRMKASDSFENVLATLNLNQANVRDREGQFTILAKIKSDINQRERF